MTSEDKQLCIACGKASAECQCSTVKVSIEDAIQAMESAQLHAGDIEGRYRIIEKIGIGGMGTVYRAEHIVLRREVAIKVLRNELLMDKMAMARFEQESRACAALSHPNLVAVFDCGINALSQPYLVMEFLNGHSLLDVIKENGPLPLKQFFDVFIEVAKALEYAHSNGVIHRDLKPSNILLCEDPRGGTVTKIVDFGVAKIEDLGGEFQMLTRTGEVFGSPAYMSPEQCQGNVVDNRSDIYAIGCVMYEALSGKQAFKGANIMTIMTKQMEDYPAPLEEMDNAIPAEVQKMVMRCLQKEPNERFQSMLEVQTELERLQYNSMTSRPVRIGNWNLPSTIVPIMVSLAVLACIIFYSALMPGGSVGSWAGALKSAPTSKAMLGSYTHMRHMFKTSTGIYESLIAGPESKNLSLADRCSITAVLFEKLNGRKETRGEILRLFGTTVSKMLDDIERAANQDPSSIEACSWSAPLVYYYIGSAYEKNNFYNEAQKKYLRGLELAKKLKSPLWVVAKMEEELGEVYLTTPNRQPKLAIPLLKDAQKHLAAEKKTIREGRSEAYRDITNLLFQALKMTDQNAEAVKVQTEYIEYLKSQDNDNNAFISSAIKKIVDHHRERKDYGAADTWRKELSKYQSNDRRMTSDRDTREATTSSAVLLTSAWQARLEQRPWSEIVDAYELAISKAKTDLDRFAIAAMAFETACEYSLFDDAQVLFKQMEPSFSRVEAALQKTPSTEPRPYTGQAAIALYYLAYTEYKTQKYDQVSAHLELARKLNEGQPDEVWVSGRLDELDGLLAYTKKDYRNSEKLLLRAVQKLRRIGGQNNVRVGEALYELGRTYGELKHYTKAKECFNEAVRVFNVEPWAGWNKWRSDYHVAPALRKVQENEAAGK